MKINNIVACGLISLFSMPIAAEVTLKLPSEINILSINGEEGKSGLMGFISSSPDKIILPNGDNQIVYDIKKIFNQGSTQSEVYQSSPLVLTFNSTDSELELSIPPLPTPDAARRFDRSTPVKLGSKSGASIEYTNERLPLDGFSFSIKKDYSALLANYNQSSDYKHDSNSDIKPKPATLKSNSAVKTSSKVAILQDVFNELDDKEKQEFLSWAIKNLN